MCLIWRRSCFFLSLKDSAAQIVETIWPLSTVALRSDTAGCKSVLPLRVFIQETLRRSRSSYSTLQVALYYLILVKNQIPRLDFTMEQPKESACSRAMQCGRRMFLAALILASKYLQDRNYSSRAWSKISGLSTTEINQNEFAFLDAVNWKLHISESVFQRWTDIVLKYTPKPGDSSNGEGLCWSTLIPMLTGDLDVGGPTKYEQQLPPPSSPAHALYLSAQPSPSPCHTPVPPHPDRLSGVADINAASEQTPTDACQNNNNNNIPKTLEPNPQMDNSSVPLPPIPKLGLLPTPQMTPHSNVTSTPAAGAGGFDQSKPSIGAALSRANSMGMQRCTMDRRPPMNIRKQNSFEASGPLCRRSSLARSGSSSSSSPDSTASDVPSLDSMQSSGSSSSSSSHSSEDTGAAVQSRLPSRPTLPLPKPQGNWLKESRKSLTIGTPIAEGDACEIVASPEQLAHPAPNIPDLTNFSLGPPEGGVSSTTTAATAAQEAAEGLCALSGNVPAPVPRSHPSVAANHLSSTNSTSTLPTRRSRKRGRSTASEDTVLQENVRHLMATTNGAGSRKKRDDGIAVLPDGVDDNSFPLPVKAKAKAKAAQSATEFPAVKKMPLSPYPGSLKRACCQKDEDEAAAGFLFALRPGPPFGAAGVEGPVDVVD